MIDLVDRIIAYENDEMDEFEYLELFTDLVESGVITQLQGHYQRTAQHLLEQGMICREE